VDSLLHAIELFKSGKPVLIHDSSTREDEVDMVYHASFITYKEVYMLRTVAGGLICYVMPYEVGRALGLKFMDEILSITEFKDLTSRRLSYGDKPAFSLWVNYVGVRTGISDMDRALTISKLYEVTEYVVKGVVDVGRRMFYESFISPGHVPILLSRGVNLRRGHTELSELLARLAGLTPATVIAEVLDEGTSMSLSNARKLAERLGTVLVDGDALLQYYLRTSNLPTT
jgi:3,4-dihydroxy 2-butanone 4-phosphate synthase